jgi:hypothetical protein
MLIVDGAAMVATPALGARDLADADPWRVVLIGDPLQYMAVGRGGRFDWFVEHGRAIEGVVYTADLGLTFWGAVLSREAASLEAVHGDLHDALDLFDSAIQSQHRANNVAHAVAVLASLAVFFNRLDEPLVAATIYGSSTPYGTANRVKGLRDACEQLHATLGNDLFERSVSRGAAMNLTEAVHHARREIQRAHLLGTHGKPRPGAGPAHEAGQ